MQLSMLAQRLFPEKGMALLIFDLEPLPNGKEPLHIATNVGTDCLLYKLEAYITQVSADPGNLNDKAPMPAVPQNFH